MLTATVHQTTRERLVSLGDLHPATDSARTLLLAGIRSSDALALYARVSLQEPAALQPGLFALEEAHQPSAEIARSLYVFAGATLDLVIKQLVRDTLPSALAASPAARARRHKFLDSQGAEVLRRFAQEEDSSEARDQHYVWHLTRGSLQQAGRVEEVLRALGLEAPSRADLGEVLGPVLKARNEIVHDLDVEPGTNGLRRSRNAQAAISEAGQVFGLLIDILEGVHRLLDETPS